MANERDLRIDLLRGLALLFIFIDHIPDNGLAHFTLRNFGFADAAEVFVLLAGFSAVLAYQRSFEREGFRAGAARVMDRVRDIYLWHLALVAFCAIGLTVAAVWFENPMYSHNIGVHVFGESPAAATFFAATLINQPNMLNILPLYIVLMLVWVPFVLWLLPRRPWQMLFVSASLWLIASLLQLNLPSQQAPQGWVFNPFAWQLLITVGALAAHFSREEPIPASRVTIALAGAYVAFAFLVAAPWTQIAGLQDARFFAPDLLGSMNKSYLSPLAARPRRGARLPGADLNFAQKPVAYSGLGQGRIALWPAFLGNLLPRNGTFVYRVGDFGRSRRWTSRADPGQYGRYWHPLDHGMGLSTAQSRHRVRTVLAQSALRLALAVAAGLSPAVANAAPPCEAPVNLLRFNAPLPGLSSALASSKPIRIVALGSSSTQGIGASSPKACYPSRLQAELRKRYPDKEIIVDNLGVGGQLATDMIPRIKKDVLPLHPNVVIWQTGVNDAMRQVDVDKFRQTVMLGIDQLQQAGIDVVLLDMQYFPRADTIAAFPRYLSGPAADRGSAQGTDPAALRHHEVSGDERAVHAPAAARARPLPPQ